MTIGPILHQIAADAQLQTIILLIAVDFVFGVAAALRLRTFQLSYLANFVRNDVVSKALGWAAIDALAIVAPGASVLWNELDWTNTSHALFLAATAALVGSIAGSLKELGLAGFLPAALGSGR